VNPVIVVGAGISGIAAARFLRAAGRPVMVLDRGHRIGGRMAVRTADDRPVDIGASYFTVSDPSFREVVDDWQRRGLARPWTDTFHIHSDAELTSRQGPMRWAAPRGLRFLVEDLAEGLDIRRQQVTQIEPGLRVDQTPAAAVVLAMPDPQAVRLLDPSFDTEIAALTDPFQPVLVLTVSWSQRCWPDDIAGVFVNDDATLAWIADDGHRRGDHAPVLVAHSTPGFAAEHLASPAEAAGPMLAALQRVLSIDRSPTTSQVHRWTFGKPAASRTDTHFLRETLIGLCGDAWSDRPRVESAFTSGTALAAAIERRLG
jgi:renalase